MKPADLKPQAFASRRAVDSVAYSEASPSDVYSCVRVAVPSAVYLRRRVVSSRHRRAGRPPRRAGSLTLLTPRRRRRRGPAPTSPPPSVKPLPSSPVGLRGASPDASGAGRRAQSFAPPAGRWARVRGARPSECLSPGGARRTGHAAVPRSGGRRCTAPARAWLSTPEVSGGARHS